MKIGWLVLSCSLVLCCSVAAKERASQALPLRLVKTFSLKSDVTGRFDHFAADLQHNRLFVVPKDYKSILVLDLRSGEVLHNIDQLSEPQGVLYRADLDTVYVADGERGTVEIIDGKTYRTEKSVKLRPDADAIAYDPASQYLYVVNGGADAKMTHTVISVVDTAHGATVGEIEVDGDSLEAMALEKASPTMYVDNRAKNEVDVINRQTHEMVATWPVTLGKTMVALVLDEASHRLFVGCRDGNIVIFDVLTGKELQALSIGKGIDDLVFDASSKRLYAACGGSGTVDVYEEVDADHYRSLGQIPSGPLARNGLLIPSLKQYFVAVPKSANEPARILVYQVQ